MRMKPMLPYKVGRHWKFPFAGAIVCPTLPSVRNQLPGYVTYAEFRIAMDREVKHIALPEKRAILRAVRQISVGRDFLMLVWKRDVMKAWRASVRPLFAFKSTRTGDQFWWCMVSSAKRWGAYTCLLLAVDSTGRLMRYALYASGQFCCCGCTAYIRFHDAQGRESEEMYFDLESLISDIRKMVRKGDNMAYYEECRNEYVQAIRNRDGSFYVEYQLYHMPWQMCLEKVTIEQLLDIVRKFGSRGVPGIANSYAWSCSDRPPRVDFDLRNYIRKRVQKLRGEFGRVAMETMRVLDDHARDVPIPLFLKRGRPVWWEYSLRYLPKRLRRIHTVIVEFAAAISERDSSSYPYSLGLRFLKGRGAPRDRTLALSWLKYARKKGNRSAAEVIARLNASECTIRSLRR